MTQLSFFGEEPPRRPGGPASPSGGANRPRPDPLIFVIRPDRVAAGRALSLGAALSSKHGLKGRPLPPERLHITLQCLPSERRDAAYFVPVANEIAAGLQSHSIELSLTKALSFRSGRGSYPFVLSGEPDEELKGLFDDLGQGMKAVGLGRYVSKSLTPHMTLLYDATMVAPEPIEPVTWRATELLLIHSLRGLGRHDVLARWPLR